MSVSETLSVVSGLPGFRELGSLVVSELRVEPADVRRLRAVLDGRLVDIVRRIEKSTREVGTHERDTAETSMRGDVLSPNARWVSVRSSEIFVSVSPLSGALCPHRRMDGICSFGSTMNDIVRSIDGGVLGASVRLLCLCRDLTRVETVQHPLGRVDV